jgi:alpha-methylacyl-CoA racemase
MLEGVTVLDLSTVGPAARASRWLADYGARVVKVGAPEGLQIEPPFYAYSAHRGMERVGIDLKSAEGMDQFRSSTVSASATTRSAGATRTSFTARPAATGRPDRGHSGRATT